MKFHTLTRCFVIVSLIAFTLPSIAETTKDWYQWRGPNSDGVSLEKWWSPRVAQGGLKQLWKFSVGTGYSSVSVSNGKLYTIGNANKTDTVYCLNANTGDVIWKYSYPCAAEGDGHPGTASTPTVDGKSVYTLSRDGDLFCFGSDTGKVVWSKKLQSDFGAKLPQWSLASSPLVLDKMLIVNASMTMALDKANGKLIWKGGDYGGGYSSPVAFKLGNSRYLAIFNILGLVILKSDSGQEVTQQQWKTSYDVNAATPIISGDKIFISSGYNVGGALFQFTGNSLKELWKNKNMRNHFNNSVLWQGHLYGFDEEQLRCLNFQTGSAKWTQKGMGKGSLMIADGKLIIMSDSGDLVIADASSDSFKELARLKVLSGLCWTVPVLSGGKIYCRNHEGDLVCVDSKN